MKRVLFALFALFLFAGVAAAQPVPQTKPLFDKSRISLSIGLDYAWYASPLETSAPVPFYKHEWEPTIAAAYDLTKSVHIGGSVSHGLDNKLVRAKLGLRFSLIR